VGTFNIEKNKRMRRILVFVILSVLFVNSNAQFDYTKKGEITFNKNVIADIDRTASGRFTLFNKLTNDTIAQIRYTSLKFGNAAGHKEYVSFFFIKENMRIEMRYDLLIRSFNTKRDMAKFIVQHNLMDSTVQFIKSNLDKAKAQFPEDYFSFATREIEGAARLDSLSPRVDGNGTVRDKNGFVLYTIHKTPPRIAAPYPFEVFNAEGKSIAYGTAGVGFSGMGSITTRSDNRSNASIDYSEHAYTRGLTMGNLAVANYLILNNYF
jgi:hypothetical protein